MTKELLDRALPPAPTDPVLIPSGSHVSFRPCRLRRAAAGARPRPGITYFDLLRALPRSAPERHPPSIAALTQPPFILATKPTRARWIFPSPTASIPGTAPPAAPPGISMWCSAATAARGPKRTKLQRSQNFRLHRSTGERRQIRRRHALTCGTHGRRRVRTARCPGNPSASEAGCRAAARCAQACLAPWAWRRSPHAFRTCRPPRRPARSADSCI